MNNAQSEKEMWDLYLNGREDEIILPQTRFPIPGSEWHLIADGKNLPAIGQEILYVWDCRGTQLEATRNMMMRIADGNPNRLTEKTPSTGSQAVDYLIAKTFELPTKQHPDQEVRLGWVGAINIHDETGDYWLDIRTCKHESSHMKNYENAEYVTYWRPMVAPPPDTYKESPFDYYRTWNIIQAKALKAQSVKDET